MAWPTKEDGVPKLESFNWLDTFTDSNWGPQDASHPQPGQTIQDEDVRLLLGVGVNGFNTKRRYCIINRISYKQIMS